MLERDDAAVDRTPPRVLKAIAVGTQRVDVTFSEPLDRATACDPANYAVDRSVQVLAVAWLDDTVRLTTSPLAHDVRYTLAVRNVRDRAKQPNVIHSGAKAQFILRSPDRPLVVLALSKGQGQTAANTGASSETHLVATLTPLWPKWSKNVPPAGDGVSLDFGEAIGEYAVDLGSDAPQLLRNLKSFTITGWVNCRSLKVGSGGNRIVHMADTLGSRAGLDLVVEKNGALVLGVNAYPDASPARSRPNAITVDAKAGPDNWRFFAVSYDATAAAKNVRFYIGDVHRVAKLDRSVTYTQGSLGARTGPLTIGAFNPKTRAGNGDRMFRGLIDDVRVFGSVIDGAGALDLEEIRIIQKGK